MPMGSATSNRRPTSGPKKSGGMTPTIVNGTRSSVSRRADRVGGSAESTLPERVADDGDRPVGAAAAAVVGLGERPADERRDAERVEHAGRRPDAVDEFGDAAIRQIEALRVPREDAVEQLADRWRSRARSDRSMNRWLARIVSQDRELVRRFDRQRAERQAVDQREDRGVRANTEGERQHGDRADDRRRDQLPERDADVVSIAHAAAGPRSLRQLEKRCRVQRVERGLRCARRSRLPRASHRRADRPGDMRARRRPRATARATRGPRVRAPAISSGADRDHA